MGLAAGQLTGERTNKQGQKVISFPPLDGMSAALLRAIPFSASVRYGGALPDTTHHEPNPSTTHRPAGERDRFYAQVAAAYLARLEAGNRRPVADVAKRRRLFTAQVRDAIHTARERGLLTSTTKQGRPGGQLTAFAKALRGRTPAKVK